MSELEALYADKIGTTVRLSEIFAIARAITQRYAAEGYPLSLAYVPVQEIENGAVRIRVLEGFVGDVDVSDAPKKMQARLRRLARKITSERPLTKKSLERYLLLANQLPGVQVKGVLKRAASPEDGVGMILKVDRKRVAASVGVNNRASRAVGREQVNGNITVNGLATGTDSFRFLAVQSVNVEELTFFSSGYQAVVTPEGLTLGLAATRSEAAPGVPLLRDLGFETNGWTATASAAYPLLLSRKKQINLTAAFNWKEFESAFGVTPNTRDVLWTSEFGSFFKFDDPFKGKNAVGLKLVRGWDVFDATEAGSPLASRQGAGGEFIAFIVDASRRQPLTDDLTLAVSAQAQTANNPLLSSEQCGFGGAGFGRGYDPFEIAGDRCATVLLELGYAPDFLKRGKVKAAPYLSFDAGAVRQIGPLAAGEQRTQSLYSLAAGARVNLTKYVAADLQVGVPLKGVVAQEGDDDPRFFFSITARY